MSSNIHDLQIPKMVEDLGLLWTHSCFPFESAIGELLKLFHGSQGIEKASDMCLHIMVLNCSNISGCCTHKYFTNIAESTL